MLGVDDLLREVWQRCIELGIDDRTYLIYVSDNGYMQGHHRYGRGKVAPWEPSIRVPFVAMGPGIMPGQSCDEMVLNSDWAATWLDLADQIPAPDIVDGRSLKRSMMGVSPQAARKCIVIQHMNHVFRGNSPIRESVGIRVQFDDGNVYKYLYYPLTGQANYVAMLESVDELTSLPAETLAYLDSYFVVSKQRYFHWDPDATSGAFEPSDKDDGPGWWVERNPSAFQALFNLTDDPAEINNVAQSNLPLLEHFHSKTYEILNARGHAELIPIENTSDLLVPTP